MINNKSIKGIDIINIIGAIIVIISKNNISN